MGVGVGGGAGQECCGCWVTWGLVVGMPCALLCS